MCRFFLLGQIQRTLELDVILFHFQWEFKPLCCYFYAENLAILSISPYILSWIMHKMSFNYPLTKDHLFAGCIASTHPPVCVMLLSSKHVVNGRREERPSWGVMKHGLTKYPCPEKQFSRHNSTSKHAWFSQSLIPSVDDLPFSSSSPCFSPSQTSWRRTNTGSIVYDAHLNTAEHSGPSLPCK